ncbi:heme o synthase [Evansella tamaricis]|uniref:Protoheme IX farnesyltransferase n=1 Tax=Evansella tamaricis TaxID=2069301 RepID=A0ABS6J9L9_9BACI|nr:heme o synthase [Evansella tamaricis]MBU9710376.1 heme o synthase [Evansella tamaricis]
MSKLEIPIPWNKDDSQPQSNHYKVKSAFIQFLSDIAYLIKAPVLLANILPVFTGYWLSLHFTNSSFGNHFLMFFFVITGSTLVMAGALVINNWYDHDIDKVMARTLKRPTVTGNIPLSSVYWLGISLSVLGFILLLFTTWSTVLYSFIGWFTYVVLYTMWTKRRYTLNTVIGSISGAVTPLIGWAAIAPVNHIVPIILFLLLFIWQMPHTFAIAIRKYEEYREARVAMLPVVHGFPITKRQTVVYIACLLPLPFYLGDLGTAFIGITTIMNFLWLALAFYGLFTKYDTKWATIVFLYSVNYITIVFLVMVIVTWPVG